MTSLIWNATSLYFDFILHCITLLLSYYCLLSGYLSPCSSICTPWILPPRPYTATDWTVPTSPNRLPCYGTLPLSSTSLSVSSTKNSLQSCGLLCQPLIVGLVKPLCPAWSHPTLVSCSFFLCYQRVVLAICALLHSSDSNTISTCSLAKPFSARPQSRLSYRSSSEESRPIRTAVALRTLHMLA